MLQSTNLLEQNRYYQTSSLKPRFKASGRVKKLNIGYFGSLFKSRGINLIIKLSNLDKQSVHIYGAQKTNKFFKKNIKIKI